MTGGGGLVEAAPVSAGASIRTLRYVAMDQQYPWLQAQWFLQFISIGSCSMYVRGKLYELLLFNYITILL